MGGAPEHPVAPAVVPPPASPDPPFEPGADRQAEHGQQAADVVADEPEPPDALLWEAVTRHCPWPPLPASWQVLDEPCRSAMDRLRLAEEQDTDARGWREVLAHPVAARRAVAAALDRPECRVPEGETRPGLHEACSAEAMLRLASLQDKCVERLHTDWERVRDRSRARVERIAESQEEYHRLVESAHRSRAHIYWETYICRTVPAEAFAWVGVLPEPPGDPTAHRYNRPPITQALDLYDAARRLGADIPDWATGQLELIAESAKLRAEQPGFGETEGETVH